MDTVRHYRLSDIINESNVEANYDSLILNCVGIDTRTDKFHTLLPSGRHDNYIIYMIKGELTVFKEDGQAKDIKPGMGIIYHSNRQYNYIPKTDVISYYWIHFTGSDAKRVLNRFKFYNEYIFDIGFDEQIIHLFQGILREFTFRKPDYNYSAALRMLQIFVEIKRRTTNSVSINHSSLEDSLTYIHDHFTEDIPIEQLAKIEKLSVSHYRSIFTRQMDVSPKQYIINLRMSEAAKLLHFTNIPIKAVADKCGYYDIGYFHRTFKKNTGMTPTEYRNSN